MKSLKDILAVVIGLLAAAGAIFYFYKFVTFTDPQGGHNFGWMAHGLAAIAFVCGLIYFLGNVNKKEEIHITKYQAQLIATADPLPPPCVSSLENSPPLPPLRLV